MANSKNLKSNSERTPKERKELAQKAGLKSGEARRARKTLKEELLLLLESGNTQNKMSLAIIKKALKGDIKAFEVIRDTIGEKPIDKQLSAQTKAEQLNIIIDEKKIKKAIERTRNLADE